MARTQIESAVCPVCQAPGELQFMQRDLYCGIGAKTGVETGVVTEADKDGEFGQNRCAACNVFFLSPRVPEDEIGAWYPDSYEPYLDAATPDIIARVFGAFAIPRKRQRIVERFVTGGRLLDVGCGNGAFLEALDGTRWRKYAMDLEWHGAGPRPGNFHRGRFDHEPPHLEALDALTMWHVFEHFYHPQRALDHAAALLRDGGYLFIAIPDHRSLDRWMFGKYWCGWDIPRHVATYSASALESLLGKSHFRLRAVVPEATGANFALNIAMLLRARGIPSQLQRSLTARAVYSPFVFLANRLGLSGAKVYVAQR